MNIVLFFVLFIIVDNYMYNEIIIKNMNPKCKMEYILDIPKINETNNTEKDIPNEIKIYDIKNALNILFLIL